MNAAQIQTLKDSFNAVTPMSELAAALFYNRLFRMDPSLKAMFKGDMRTQGKKLMATLGFAIRSLDHPEKIVPALRELGRRHATYGVRPEHYKTVSQALLWTLEVGLGTAYTAEVKDAWNASLLWISAQMIAAGEEQAAQTQDGRRTLQAHHTVLGVS